MLTVSLGTETTQKQEIVWPAESAPWHDPGVLPSTDLTWFPGYSPLCVAKEANTTLVLLPEVQLSRHAEVFHWI